MLADGGGRKKKKKLVSSKRTKMLQPKVKGRGGCNQKKERKKEMGHSSVPDIFYYNEKCASNWQSVCK